MSMFNSRTCGLVLGAGAMQVAKLKSITAKHLGKLNPLYVHLILIVFFFIQLWQQNVLASKSNSFLTSNNDYNTTFPSQNIMSSCSTWIGYLM